MTMNDHVDYDKPENETEQIKELKELLIEYGRHQPGCPNQYDKKYHCRCGWEEVEQDLKGK